MVQEREMRFVHYFDHAEVLRIVGEGRVAFLDKCSGDQLPRTLNEYLGFA